jgi:putative CocE/NonD family hydrolase
MGSNKWQSAESFPPAGAQAVTFYLSSNGKANTLTATAISFDAAANNQPDSFVYDPMNPVPSYGGNVCCTGNAVNGGSFDQRKIEERPDILVYSTEPLKEGIELTGSIDVTLYVSSDVQGYGFYREAD